MNKQEQIEEEVKPVHSFYSIVIKRALDIIFSGFAIVILSPLFLVIALLELVFHGKPILYGTKRPGKDGKIFKMYKFRSMTNERGPDGFLLPEEERLTKFGIFIRKTSLDELPELFNVLIGDMSIIGPRPLLVEYLPLYSMRHAMRHSVRPGLACERIDTSVSNTWTWGEQFDNDIWYIENISLITDIKMLGAIFRKVIRRDDYRAYDTRVPFNGNNLYETRNKNEVENVIRYDSISR